MTDNGVSSKNMRAPAIMQCTPKPCNKEIERLKGVIIKLEKNLDVHQFAFTQLKKENLMLRENLERVQITCSKALNESEAIFEKMNADIEDGVAHKRKRN